MTAKIGLEDVRFHAPHGFYAEEHRMGNTFSIDVEVTAEISGAAEEDDLGGTVNYATIYYLLQAEMKKPTQLLEALAYRMGNRILHQFDSVSSVTLRLRKLHPPLGGKVGAAVVEITVDSANSRGGFAANGGFSNNFSGETPDDDFGGFDDFNDDDSDFSGGGFGGGNFGGGGGLGGIIKKSPPPDEFEYDDDAFEDEGDYPEEDYLDEEDLATMLEAEADEELTDADLEEMDFGDDIDFDDDAFDDDAFDGLNFDDMDFDDMDFGDFDLPDFDPKA